MCKSPNPNPPTSIAISTDRRNYIVGDALQIYVYALDKNGCAITKKVILTLNNTKSPHIFEESCVYSDSDPAYDFYLQPLNLNENHTPSSYSFLRYNQFVLTQSGDYTLTARLVNGTDTNQASTTFRVDNLENSRPAEILYIAIAFFAGLLIVIALGIRINYALSEILRFICISGIIISVVSIFIFIDEPIGANGPVGLVKKPMNSSSFSSEQWAINIGGTSKGPFDTLPYTTGIQIPIYVVIFGIAGGYLRYLYKTSKLGISDKALQEGYIFTWNRVPGIDEKRLKSFLKERFNIDWLDGATVKFKKSDDEKTIEISDEKHNISIKLNDEKTNAQIAIDNIYYCLTAIKQNGTLDIYQETGSRRKLSFYQSLEDLSLLFLSPLLAVAIWFVLSQWTPTQGGNNFYILAAVSFTVGLVTDEIVQFLIKLTESVLRVAQKEEEKPVKA